jgi:uncharacterized protein (DUF2062 family)
LKGIPIMCDSLSWDDILKGIVIGSVIYAGLFIIVYAMCRYLKPVERKSNVKETNIQKPS